MEQRILSKVQLSRFTGQVTLTGQSTRTSYWRLRPSTVRGSSPTLGHLGERGVRTPELLRKTNPGQIYFPGLLGECRKPGGADGSCRRTALPCSRPARKQASRAALRHEEKDASWRVQGGRVDKTLRSPPPVRASLSLKREGTGDFEPSLFSYRRVGAPLLRFDPRPSRERGWG